MQYTMFNQTLATSTPALACCHSRHVQRWLAAAPARQAQVLQLAAHSLLTCDLPQLLQEIMAGGKSRAGAMRYLRNLLLSALIERDLNGSADLHEVVSTISNFADFAVQTHTRSLHADLCALYGNPIGEESGTEQELMVIGMGKLGAHELNVSSDIDLIFIYGEDGDTRAGPGQKSLSNHEFFTRLGKKLIADLSEISEDGYCFRVDMALRPNGKSGPLAASLAMLEEYFMVQGREWERYAWVKARAMTGSETDQQALASLIKPFVYRRYLDFGVIESLRNMHAQIRAEVVRQEKQSLDKSTNVKLGRGGIREIEFLAQVFQLIRGGRDAALRARGTRAILRELAAQELLQAQAVERLLQSYTFLRNLEHRLQYLEDAQTHTLPEKEADLELIANMMGFADSAAFLQQLGIERAYVASQFDAIFADKENEENSAESEGEVLRFEGEQDKAHIQSLLAHLGYADAASAAQRLHAAWNSTRLQAMSETSRNRLLNLLNRALPLIIEICAQRHAPQVVLGRLLDFFEAIARRAAYLSLLQEYPHTLTRVIRLMAASNWAAQFLNQHPILLDELLDEGMQQSEPDWQELSAQLRQQLQQAAGDAERQHDILREVHHAQLFRLLLLDLEGRLSVERLADHLSALADICVAATLEAVWQHLPQRHCEIPKFAVIAYGRLGGKELGYVSDLDVIFLFDDEDENAQAIYAKLAQRFISWMTTHTPAGILFDIDTALRPDGASGTLVSSVQAFERYQHNSAWVWEHQALTRARFCAGDTAIGARFEEIRRAVLCKERDSTKLKQEVVAMRQKMRSAYANKAGALFDLKQDAGGMIDVEFIVQYLVLQYAQQHPQLCENLGNIALLKRCAELGLISSAAAHASADAYRLMRKLQHQKRLQGEDKARIAPEEVERERQAVQALWQEVLGV